GYKPSGEKEKKDAKDPGNEDSEIPSTKEPKVDQEEKDNVNSTNRVNAVSLTVNTANNEVNVVGRKSSIELPDDPNMSDLEDINIFKDSNEDVFGAEANLNNMESTFQVFRNKLDERGIVIRNKARLVAQGHIQEEGIDYDEVFTPVARIKAIRLILSYASFKGFVVYQMDVKSVFLYGKIKEEEMCTEFEKMMHKKFQMSSIGELTFFLGLQVKQKEDGIFISQDKYVNEILNDSPFDLVAYTDSDYAGASLDRKSTTGGYQFLGCRLILGSARSRLWLLIPQQRLRCLEWNGKAVKDEIGTSAHNLNVSAVKYN
nr:copia protein [Tanacetum cinerariifolium]